MLINTLIFILLFEMVLFYPVDHKIKAFLKENDVEFFNETSLLAKGLTYKKIPQSIKVK